jgi:hypothetical protein
MIPNLKSDLMAIKKTWFFTIFYLQTILGFIMSYPSLSRYFYTLSIGRFREGAGGDSDFRGGVPFGLSTKGRGVPPDF